MTRKEARDNGFKIIFEYEFQKTGAQELLALFYELNPDVNAQTDYLDTLVKTTLDKLPEIDAMIEGNARGWTLERISKVSLAALRIGICELLYNDEVPASIAINEAVELAKVYEGEKASGFVNGILSSVFKAAEK